MKDSPFKMRGPPGTIPIYPYFRPLGAEGPGGERLAFTWITEPRPDLAAAKSFVGRCFLAAQTSPDLQGSIDFYRSTFGNNPSPIRRLPSFALATVTLSNGSRLEVDEHRGPGRPRPRVAGGLPPGLAIATFECSSFERHASKFIAAPVDNPLGKEFGGRVATIVGHAGELIELLEV
ncbi:VOC family protein [Peristeroidobacter soli]|uniref:VOC family protein n=1 Tax=Peristeroidobacter soli TaxID=2497877 RepID=UPI00101DFFCC|nr:VOC family protein [Peristeroidobacter soli]